MKIIILVIVNYDCQHPPLLHTNAFHPTVPVVITNLLQIMLQF